MPKGSLQINGNKMNPFPDKEGKIRRSGLMIIIDETLHRSNWGDKKIKNLSEVGQKPSPNLSLHYFEVF